MPPATFVVAETAAGRVTRESLEALTFARRLEGGRPEILLPGRAPLEAARELSAATGLRVQTLEAETLDRYHPDHFRDALVAVLQRERAFRLVLPHSSMGWDLAPRLAVRLNADCITAVEALDGGLPVRSCLGGKLQAVYAQRGGRLVMTVQPGAFPPAPEGAGQPAVVERRRVQPAASPIEAMGWSEGGVADAELAEAPVVAAAGRGLGKGGNLTLVRQLAAIFPRAALGASRGACDAGWLPHRLQVGATGQRVAPALYIACGISGAAQHLQGMRDAGLIVAINRDPRAAIFAVAHIGVVEDLATFLPLLIAAHRAQTASPPPE